MWFKLLERKFNIIHSKKLKAFTLVDLLVGMAVSSIVLTTVAVFTISIYLKTETNTVREALNQIINIIAEQQKYIIDTLAFAKSHNFSNINGIRSILIPASGSQNPLDNFNLFCNNQIETVYYSMSVPNLIENNGNTNVQVTLFTLPTPPSNEYTQYSGPELAGLGNSRINLQNIQLRIERRIEGNFIILDTNVRYRYDYNRMVTVPSYILRVNRASIC